MRDARRRLLPELPVRRAWFDDFRRAGPGRGTHFLPRPPLLVRVPRLPLSGRPSGARNTEGEVVPLERQRRIAYAIWTYGRSTSATQQAAVALYVHSLMGDARPGGADPAALGLRSNPRSSGSPRRERYHGPYRVETPSSGPLRVGEPASLTIRVVSAAGHALPHVPLGLSSRGVAAPRAGSERTQTECADRLHADAGRTAPHHGRVRPGRVDAAEGVRSYDAGRGRNGQRLAAPSSKRVSTVTTATVEASPVVTASASAEVVRPGDRIFARIGVTGSAGRSRHSRSSSSARSRRVRAPVRGPARTRGARSPPRATARSRSPATRSPRRASTPTARGCSAAPRESWDDDGGLGAGSTSLASRGSSRGAAIAGEAPAQRDCGSRPRACGWTRSRSTRRSSPIAIDLADGALGTPPDVARAGWWSDGLAPGRGVRRDSDHPSTSTLARAGPAPSSRSTATSAATEWG